MGLRLREYLIYSYGNIDWAVNTDNKIYALYCDGNAIKL